MRTHDLIGIGLGPFNLGLACLADPLPLDAVFLEARGEFRWHPGMMLEDSTLQVPFMADLVTMADPTSWFSYLNHLKQQGRLYPFYVRESFFPYRSEYDAYCRWAVEQLDTVEFHRHVTAVEWDEPTGTYTVRSVDPRDGTPQVHHGRHVVVGVGSTPYVPPPLRDLDGPVWHSAQYLDARPELLGHQDVTVVGSGQSAAEVVSDLLAHAGPTHRVRWITRSPRFFPLEYTKLTLELTSPEYSRHVQSLDPRRREDLLRSQVGLYKGISADLVNTIHEQLYRRSLGDAVPAQLVAACEVTGVVPDGAGHRLRVRHTELDERFELRTDAIVLATGYSHEVPTFLDPVKDRLHLDSRGRLEAGPTFAVDVTGRGVFVQNAELHTHGIVAPDLGMGAWRNSVILAEVLGYRPYPIEQRVAFQQFGVPTDAVPPRPADLSKAAR
ncbi:lysine N(6)-hydroxylase/L-ornithine N(5)-oxygenase family protein [Cellulomonas bogoriensis]|uniref:L-lysine N6-monooxygenase MbtG n=1 Tax=Cellulomonas bogoriensis 69B4 = DSM 16987 TaxID=1386082 RepID=A0A0A0BXA3_9CELL|nr:SidA/IucD/PvdA family monooxygenase [Cellulomonas bogoriensis]KGM12600.1 alcaligin biosynthesis protein [Cellulomonas bogoriensis 69B4 = DSM 16987]